MSSTGPLRTQPEPTVRSVPLRAFAKQLAAVLANVSSVPIVITRHSHAAAVLAEATDEQLRSVRDASTISATDLKDNGPSGFVRRVEVSDEPMVITRYNKPIAVMLPASALPSLLPHPERSAAASLPATLLGPRDPLGTPQERAAQRLGATEGAPPTTTGKRRRLVQVRKLGNSWEVFCSFSKPPRRTRYRSQDQALAAAEALAIRNDARVVVAPRKGKAVPARAKAARL